MNRRISQDGIDLIKHFEGCRLKAYKDSAGIWTIGYGHTGKEVFEGLMISQEEADELLEKDLAHFNRGVNRLTKDVKYSMNQHRFDAFVAFSFNVGLAAFEKSTLLKRFKQLNFRDRMVPEFTRWIYVGEQPLRGLLLRRQAEQRMFLGFDWRT